MKLDDGYYWTRNESVTPYGEWFVVHVVDQRAEACGLDAPLRDADLTEHVFRQASVPEESSDALRRPKKAYAEVESDYRSTCLSAKYGSGCPGATEESVEFWRAAVAVASLS